MDEILDAAVRAGIITQVDRFVVYDFWYKWKSGQLEPVRVITKHGTTIIRGDDE